MNPPPSAPERSQLREERCRVPFGYAPCGKLVLCTRCLLGMCVSDCIHKEIVECLPDSTTAPRAEATANRSSSGQPSRLAPSQFEDEWKADRYIYTFLRIDDGGKGWCNII